MENIDNEIRYTVLKEVALNSFNSDFNLNHIAYQIANIFKNYNMYYNFDIDRVFTRVLDDFYNSNFINMNLDVFYHIHKKFNIMKLKHLYDSRRNHNKIYEDQELHDIIAYHVCKLCIQFLVVLNFNEKGLVLTKIVRDLSIPLYKYKSFYKPYGFHLYTLEFTSSKEFYIQKKVIENISINKTKFKYKNDYYLHSNNNLNYNDIMTIIVGDNNISYLKRFFKKNKKDSNLFSTTKMSRVNMQLFNATNLITDITERMENE